MPIPDDSTSAPMLKPTTLTVTPIPASESRTLRLTWLVTLWTTILSIAPDLIAFALDLLASDPQLAEAVSGAIPPRFRYAFGAIIVLLARKYGTLRKETSAPIAGTPAASPSAVQPSPTEPQP